jgi:hypothetical protein
MRGFIDCGTSNALFKFDLLIALSDQYLINGFINDSLSVPPWEQLEGTPFLGIIPCLDTLCRRSLKCFHEPTCELHVKRGLLI